MPLISANVIQKVFQPLIDAFDAVIRFFHDSIGFGWGLSIIALTVLVRILLIPLTVRQFRSMQAMQALQPEIKKLQAKYKDDKQRLNQEMMKFYQENKVNPFGSCLPLLAQFPVFISLFYMLRKDLKEDICGPKLHAYLTHHSGTFQNTGLRQGRPRQREVPLHPRPHARGERQRPDPAHRALRGLAAGLEPHHVECDPGQEPALHHARAALHVRPVREELPGGPAPLLDHHEPVDRRPGLRAAPGPRTATRRTWRRSGDRSWRCMRPALRATARTRCEEGEASSRR